MPFTLATWNINSVRLREALAFLAGRRITFFSSPLSDLHRV